MKTNTTVDSIIRTPVESNLLKWSAGQAIFCPCCDRIMDWRKTVVATIHAAATGKEEQVIRSYVTCAKCWDKRGSVVQEGVDKFNAKQTGSVARVEIVDGREERFNNFE